MMRQISQKPGRFEEDNGCEGQKKRERISWEDLERETTSKLSGSSERFQEWTPHHHDSARRGDEGSREMYEEWRREQKSIAHEWRREQKSIAARLDKELQCRWDLDELIEEQLSRYHSHYHQATVPTSLKDVTNQLVPMWLPPHELAATAWLGDWRPSSILDLLRALSLHHPSISLSDSSERLLSQIVREIRIEEAVIDEEYAEIQATSVLHLPFSPLYNAGPNADALSSVQELFRKMQRVVSKADRVRYKALEVVMKKLLNQTDTAEFLVAFAGIQDAVHQFGDHQMQRRLLPTVPLKGSGSSST